MSVVGYLEADLCLEMAVKGGLDNVCLLLGGTTLIKMDSIVIAT